MYEVVSRYGQTAKKVRVGLARRKREASLRGTARVNSQEAMGVQTSSEAHRLTVFSTSPCWLVSTKGLYPFFSDCSEHWEAHPGLSWLKGRCTSFLGESKGPERVKGQPEDTKGPLLEYKDRRPYGPGALHMRTRRDAVQLGPESHMFKNAKADGSETGASVVTVCKSAWRSCELGQGRREQATSSMPANKELGLHGSGLELSSGVSVFSSLCSDSVPCSLQHTNRTSLGSSRADGGEVLGNGVGTGLLGTTVAELRGWRKSWLPGAGTGLVSKSAGPTGAAAELGWAQGLRVGSCCPQEASKCLRICSKTGRGWRFLLSARNSEVQGLFLLTTGRYPES